MSVFAKTKPQAIIFALS